jgi:hypothetical protein
MAPATLGQMHPGNGYCAARFAGVSRDNQGAARAAKIRSNTQPCCTQTQLFDEVHVEGLCPLVRAENTIDAKLSDLPVRKLGGFCLADNLGRLAQS